MTRIHRLFAAAGLALLMLLGTIPGGVGASAAHAQAPPSAWRPGEDDQWLFELRSGRYRVGDGVRGYSDGSRSCVALTDMVLALDLPLRINPELRRATGWAFEERRSLTIDREAGRVTIGSETQVLHSTDIIDTAEGWCVDPAALGRWLGVTLTADLANSVLNLSSDRPLPFELAAQRRARAAAIRPDNRFNLADLPQARRPYAMWQTPSVDVVASATVTHDAAAGTTQTQTRYELYASGEALGASVDARLSSNDDGVPRNLRVRAYRSDPDGRLLGPLRATHVAAGDVSGLASPLATEAVVGRGAVITNRPLDLPDSFDRTSFRGELPVGWDAELYRNGQLLAFATPRDDGRYEFTDVRLQFGLNRFEIILYGPQGQVRRDVRVIPVGLDAIPPGKTYYWAGIVQEGRDLLRLADDDRPWRRGWRGTVGLERGLNRRTSMGLWATSLVIDDERYDIFEAALRRSLGPTLAELTGSIQSGGGRAARLLWSGQFGSKYFQIESILARGGFRSDRVALGITGLHIASLDISPRLLGATLPVHIEARWRQRVDGQDRLEAGGRISANWRNLTFTGQVDWARNRSRFAPDDDALVANLLVNARFGRMRLRGEAAMGLRGGESNDRVALVGEWSQSERTEWRTELGYEGGVRRARAGIGYTRRFDRLALTANAEVASDGSVAAGLAISFGFGPDPRGGRIRFSNERIAGQGQALATVFYDDNGDGQRQPDEMLAEGVVLTAGSAVVDQATDATGRAIVDALTPFRAVLIGVDESSLADPLVRPGLPGVVVVPRPGVATNVMLPLVAAGEVEGMLRRSGGNGIEGVDLELVDARGVVRATSRTDYDGFFIFESVPYGSYSLRVSTLAAQAANIAPALGAVAIDRNRPRVRLGTIMVEARASLARGPDRPTQMAAGGGP